MFLHHFTVIEPTTTLGAWLGFVALLGWAGVDLFFVLSGFLITGILIDARGSDRYFTSFYARRSLRIFPLYFLIVFVSFVVLPRFPWWHRLLAGPTAVDPLPYWTYLVNFAIASRGEFLHGVLDIAWSLAIEEQFYIVWAVVVWLLPVRWLGPMCASLVVLAPMLRNVALSSGGDAISVYVLPHFRADALAAGGLLAWLASRGSLERLKGSAAYILSAALALAIGVAVREGSPWWSEPLMQRAGYSFFALAAAGLVVVAATASTGTWPARILCAGWLRAFGKYSYALYLVHVPVRRVVEELVLNPDEFPVLFGALWPAQLLFYGLVTIPSFAVAWISWHAFEAPILRLKSRFPYSDTRAVSAP